MGSREIQFNLVETKFRLSRKLCEIRSEKALTARGGGNKGEGVGVDGAAVDDVIFGCVSQSGPQASVSNEM